MPFYQNLGDYYGPRRGDFWSKAKRAVSKVGKVMPVSAAMIPTRGGVSGALSTLQYGAPAMPGGSIASNFLPAVGAVGGGGAIETVATGLLGRLGLPASVASIGGAMVSAKLSGGGGQTYVPAAVNNPIIPDFIEKLWDGTKRKRRTMNPANVGALRRALRRVDSFRHLAKKSGALPAARRLPSQRAERCCK